MFSERPWLLAADGLDLAVRLTPKGGRDAVERMERLSNGTCVLKARVRAAPHDGAANEALRKLIARTVGVAPGRVRLVSGASARIKTLNVEGDGAQLAAKLEKLMRASAERAADAF